MTQLYSVGLQKVTGAAAGPIATFLAGSATRPDIREIGVFVASAPATGPTVGLGRPAAAGAGAATGSLGQALDPADPAATSTWVTSFATTQPTAPTVFFNRMTMPNVIGAGMVWTFGINELAVAASGNLVLWQVSALAVTYEVYIKFEE